jgi:hypothetical protein
VNLQVARFKLLARSVGQNPLMDPSLKRQHLPFTPAAKRLR